MSLPLQLALGSCLALSLAAPQTPAPGVDEEAAEPTEEPEAPREPGPRRAIAGLAGFLGQSTVTFVGRPELPAYALEVVYVFPERVRWRMQPIAEQQARDLRSLRLQYGAAVWELPPRATRSIPHTGDQARGFRLQIELRRVAMTWPAGLEWSEVPDAKGGPRRARLAGLGTIEVELDEQGRRPLRLTSYIEGQDEPFEALAEITWRESQRRWWPRSWTLLSRGKPVWKETIDSVKTGRKYRDSFFRPADRRQASEPAPEPARVQLAARVRRRTALAAEVAWPAAMDQAEAALQRARDALGEEFELDPRPIFRLDRDGHPTGFELRLRGEVANPPEGWSRSPAAEAWSAVYQGLTNIDGAALEALNARLEAGQQPGTAYVRIQRSAGRVGLVQLVLPFARGE